MTVTAFATGDTLTEKVWSKKTIDLGMDRSYFQQNGYVGEDENNIIIKYTELQKGKGDVIYLPAVGELDSSGVTGDHPMEENEEELPFYDDSVTIDQVRNAVRIEGAMTEQRTSIMLRRRARTALSNWLANLITQDTFTALGSSPTRVVYGGDATTTATIESGDYLTTTLLSKASTIAEKNTPEILPIMKGGAPVFVCCAAPDSAYDLKISDSVWGQAMREAMPRGSNNPLFKNAYGMWDGTVIQKHKYVTIGSAYGSGSNLTGAENLFMGKAAGAWAFAKMKFFKEKMFDYDNSPGVCVGTIWGVTKLVINSEDHGVITLVCYRTNNAEAAYA